MFPEPKARRDVTSAGVRYIPMSYNSHPRTWQKKTATTTFLLLLYKYHLIFPKEYLEIKKKLIPIPVIFRHCVYLFNLLLNCLASPSFSTYLKRSSQLSHSIQSSWSALVAVYQRLQFVEGLSFLRLRGVMQADSLKELVLQVNASKETSAFLVVNSTKKRNKSLRKFWLTFRLP